MKRILLYFVPLVVLLGLGFLYFNDKNTRVEDGTYVNDVNISYINRDEVDNTILQIYANTNKNKKIRIIYNNDYFVLDNNLLSIDFANTKFSFYEGAKNEIYVNLSMDGLRESISSYFSIDLSGIDIYRLALDIQNDFFSKNVNSYYNLEDYINNDIYKESYRKVDEVVFEPNDPELIYEITGGKLVIDGLSRFSYLDYFKDYKDIITSKDMSLFASAVNKLVAETSTSSFIRTNTYESAKQVDASLKPHMVYVSYASGQDASFYNDSEEDIMINVKRRGMDKIGVELFLKESQEFSKLQITNRTVRFDAVKGEDSDSYTNKENGMVYFVFKEKKVGDTTERVHIYDTYYLPVGVKVSGQ